MSNPLVQHMQNPLNGGHARAPNEPFWFPATATDHPPLVPNLIADLRQELEVAKRNCAELYDGLCYWRDRAHEATTKLRNREASLHGALRRCATVFVLCLCLSAPAVAQQAYEPTVTVLARQAQLCEQVASREIARVTEENAALKKQIEDAKGKP